MDFLISLGNKVPLKKKKKNELNSLETFYFNQRKEIKIQEELNFVK